MAAFETQPTVLQTPPIVSFALLHTRLTGMLDKLHPNDQLLLALLYFEELTAAETALVLNKTVSEVLDQHAAIVSSLRPLK